MLNREDYDQLFGTIICTDEMNGLKLHADRAGTAIEDFLRNALNFGLPLKKRVRPLDADTCKIDIDENMGNIEKPDGPSIGHAIWIGFRGVAEETLSAMTREGDPEKHLDWVWRRITAYAGHIRETHLN